jgi:hypothetical protein
MFANEGSKSDWGTSMEGAGILHIIRLLWRRPEAGGRPAPPPGPKYSTVARFAGQEKKWNKEAWSFVIEFLEQPNALLSHRVHVTFLSDKGPHDMLANRSVFELMEGSYAVAEGTVLAD